MLPDLSRLAHKSAETDIPLIPPLGTDYDFKRMFYLHVMHADEASMEVNQPNRYEVGNRLFAKTEQLRNDWNQRYHQEDREFEPRLQYEPAKRIAAIARARSGGVLIAIVLPSALEETGQGVLADPTKWTAIFKRCNDAFLLAREAMYGSEPNQKDAARSVVMPVVFLSDVDFNASLDAFVPGKTALASRAKALTEWSNRQVAERAVANLRRESTPALRYFMMARQLALMHMIKHQAATYADVLIESPPAYARGTAQTGWVVLGATPEFPLYLGADENGADEALAASLSVLIARHLATAPVRWRVFVDKVWFDTLSAAKRWVRFPVEMFDQKPTLDDELDAEVDRAVDTARQQKAEEDKARANRFATRRLQTWEERQAEREGAERVERVERAQEHGDMESAGWAVPALEWAWESLQLITQG
jgi:hypothetical protein